MKKAISFFLLSVLSLSVLAGDYTRYLLPTSIDLTEDDHHQISDRYGKKFLSIQTSSANQKEQRKHWILLSMAQDLLGITQLPIYPANVLLAHQDNKIEQRIITPAIAPNDFIKISLQNLSEVFLELHPQEQADFLFQLFLRDLFSLPFPQFFHFYIDAQEVGHLILCPTATPSDASFSTTLEHLFSTFRDKNKKQKLSHRTLQYFLETLDQLHKINFREIEQHLFLEDSTTQKYEQSYQDLILALRELNINLNNIHFPKLPHSPIHPHVALPKREDTTQINRLWKHFFGAENLSSEELALVEQDASRREWHTYYVGRKREWHEIEDPRLEVYQLNPNALNKNTLVVVPVNDKEAQAIKELCQRNHVDVLTIDSPHGVLLSDEIVARIFQYKKDHPRIERVAIVETPDISYRQGFLQKLRRDFTVFEIDHHYYTRLDRSSPRSSLEQVSELLGLRMNWKEMVRAVKDRSFFHGLRDLGMPESELNRESAYRFTPQQWENFTTPFLQIDSDFGSLPLFLQRDEIKRPTLLRRLTIERFPEEPNFLYFSRSSLFFHGDNRIVQQARMAMDRYHFRAKVIVSGGDPNRAAYLLVKFEQELDSDLLILFLTSIKAKVAPAQSKNWEESILKFPQPKFVESAFRAFKTSVQEDKKLKSVFQAWLQTLNGKKAAFLSEEFGIKSLPSPLETSKHQGPPRPDCKKSATSLSELPNLMTTF